jgi:hypothetical protein
MRVINWWSVLAVVLFLFSLVTTMVTASLGLWDCAVIAGVCMFLTYIMGRLIEDASK